MKRMTPALYGVCSLLALALAACGGTDAPRVSLAGAVDKPAELTTDVLKAAPYTEVSQDVSFISGSSTQNNISFVGVSLWEVLQTAGVKTTDGTNTKNTVLEHYVLATATDGYQSVFALGELSPDFGGKQSLVAYAQKVNGTVIALDDSTGGPFRITAAGDVKGGRYVSNAIKLDVGVAPKTAAASKPGCSGAACAVPSVVVNGQVKATATFDVAALKKLVSDGTVKEATMTENNNTYKGVALLDLLNSPAVGLKVSSRKNPTLSMYAVATGSDGYRAIVSLGEINPDFGNKQAVVAYEQNGAALTNSGALRLVIPRENKQGRLISNLAEIQVFEAGTP